MSEIFVGVLLFTAIAMALVTAVLAARAWLAPTGTATLRVNEERVVTGRRGEKLLDALRAGQPLDKAWMQVFRTTPQRSAQAWAARIVRRP